MDDLTKMLSKWISDGRIKLDESDLKNRTAATKKKLLALGAYKGTPIPLEWVEVYGIRLTKKLVDRGYSFNKDPFKGLYIRELAQSKANYEYITGKSLELSNRANGALWILKRTVLNLKTWSKVFKGKDLFVEGMGGFNIDKAIEKVTQRSGNNTTIPTVFELRLSGYFGVSRYYPSWGLRTLSRYPGVWRWIKDTKFPLERTDELNDLIILDNFNFEKLATIVSRLDDIVERDLRLNESDKKEFKYPEKITRLSSLLNLTLPDNGIELKKQAKLFKNCAGSYVRKIKTGKSFILYDKEIMIELSGSIRLIQAYGPMNKAVNEHRLNQINNVLNN